MTRSALGEEPAQRADPGGLPDAPAQLAAASGAERRGVRHMLASALAFSLMSLFVKLAGERLPTSEIVLARSLASLALSWILLRRKRMSPWGQDRRMLLLRGLLGFFALASFYTAVRELPLAEATLLHFLNPIATAVFAALFLGERAGPLTAAGLLLGLAGTALVAQPAQWFGVEAEALELSRLGVLAGLSGALFSGAAYTVVRRLVRREDPLVVVFYFPLVAVPAVLPFVVEVAVWPTPLEWLWLALVGLCTQVGQVELTRGLRLLPAGRAMAISYLQVPFAALWGFACFGDLPTAWTLAGALLVVLGYALAARR